VFDLCGFPLGYGLTPPAPSQVMSPERASFNRVNYFLIHSTLASQGIRYNQNWDSIIAKVMITVPPGSEINFEPYQPLVSTPDELIGSTISKARFWLTDQNGVSVDTFGDSWSVALSISYWI
jgi:hypothetical protein